MNNRDLILELLDAIHPEACCDDCLSGELGIEPRQQVNQLAHRLKEDGKIRRERGVCSLCKKPKTTNAVILTKRSLAKKTRALSASPEAEAELDIEQTRAQIMQICHAIWKQYTEENPPHSISVLVGLLKEQQFIPAHQANLMLALCDLRNVYIFENVAMGPRELTIAQNALSIIQEWWEKRTQ